MKIGFVGVGKLGLPVSLMYAIKGNHTLLCYDINPLLYNPHNYIDCLYDEEKGPDNIISLKEYIKDKNYDLQFTTLNNVCSQSDLIFVAIQTPHEYKYEGTLRLSEERKDFDYTFLINAMKDINKECIELNVIKPVTIISTVLPGTLRKLIIPYISSDHIQLCYNPYFIAMGTVAYDCLNPEFILFGLDTQDNQVYQLVETFYNTICINKPIIHKTTLENAELIKVCYNTFISSKIAIANTIMEVCHHCPNTDCDDVMNALFLANRRIISTSYLRGGMGDGGGCHPRDNIAMSYLANKLGIKYNWFDIIMTVREQQTEFLVDLIIHEFNENPLYNIVILGKSFKANTAIITGSPSVLLGNILDEKQIDYTYYDPHIKSCNNNTILQNTSIFFIGCCHDIFHKLSLPNESILIDPFRQYKHILSKGKYIPVGQHIN